MQRLLGTTRRAGYQITLTSEKEADGRTAYYLTLHRDTADGTVIYEQYQGFYDHHLLKNFDNMYCLAEGKEFNQKSLDMELDK